MSLSIRINDDLKTAMKAHEATTVSTLRMLRSAIKDKEIETRQEVSDEQVQDVILRLIKQRNDAATQYAAANRADLQQKELAEVLLYTAYLPAQLTEAEVSAVIAQGIAELGVTSPRDMGKLMGWLNGQLRGKADMTKVSALVKTAIASL